MTAEKRNATVEFASIVSLSAMMSELTDDDANLRIAQAWCASKGPEWSVLDTAGRGGTAPVFTVSSPHGNLALKILDAAFSEGEMGRLGEIRVSQQVALGVHECPQVVKIYDGGRFDDRLFLVMNKAPGRELEKCLLEIPRNKIRRIIDQVARACIFLRENGLCHRDIKTANIFVSDDFDRITLLDLSVMREIYDPVGIGTDHGGQLPVVATSRYSPPEYLFRLADPSPEFWHALDIYQLGGVLHDLIMREPMFESQYAMSKENRYRFAWIVATQDPVVEASDVDQDIVALARRSLDKDWQRRVNLRLEDFLMEQENIRALSLEALGLGIRPRATSSTTETPHKKSMDMARAIEDGVSQSLTRQGVTATHEVKAGSGDAEKQIVFEWDPSLLAANSPLSRVILRYIVSLEETSLAAAYKIEAQLEAVVNGVQRGSSLRLPNVQSSDAASSVIVDLAITSMADLAKNVMQANEEEAAG